MSFLPDNGGFGASWVAAACGSGALHGVAILAVVGLWNHSDAWQLPDSTPDFTITLQQLDTNALVGPVEQSGVVGVDPNEVPTGIDPDAQWFPNGAGPDAQAPDDPDDPGDTDPQGTETDPTETALLPSEPPTDPLSPEEPTMVAPNAAGPIEPDPMDPDPMDPGPNTQEPVETPSDPVVNNPDTQHPVIVQGGSSTQNPAQTPVPNAQQPSAQTPESPTEQPAGQSQPQGSEPENGGTSAEGPRQHAMLPSDIRNPDTGPDGLPRTGTTAPSIARPPTQQDIALGALIEKIQTEPAPPCLVALPRRAGQEGAGLALIGSDVPKMQSYAKTLVAEFPDEIIQTQDLIDPRQCPALTFASQNKAYPASRLGVRLDSTEVPSGGRLSGVVRGVGGKSLLILVVDVNGVVQSLERFTTRNGNFARFEVPVTRTGPGRDTKQVLLILAASTPTQIIEDRLGQLAQDVFAGLDGHPVADAAMAITTFDVR